MWDFQHRVPLQDITLHGTWYFNAVWTYIKSLSTASSPMVSPFREIIKRHPYMCVSVRLLVTFLHKSLYLVYL